MTCSILLINTNVARPPVSPVGLEYVGEALIDAGVPVHVLDFSFASDWKASLQKQLRNDEPLAVGLSVRNTDDCSFVSRKSFLPWIGNIVTELRGLTGAPIILGGVGFSTMPDVVLQATQTDGGIEGDGEEALLALTKCLVKGENFTQLPNMVYWHDGKVVRNSRVDVDLRHLPVPRRRLFDNRRYEQFGAMVGIETKRGCSGRCIFCADPVAKGKTVRLRPAENVVQEIQYLSDQGVSWLHLCDSEFNIPMEHAKDVCRAIIKDGLGERIRWYCYCSPIPFDEELTRLMKAAGCAGINFGVDSLCDEQLYRLGRMYLSNDVAQLVRLVHTEGLNYMCDLLIGGPGETAETVEITINGARELNIALVGIATGVRVYPHTPLGKAVASGSIKEGLHPETSGDQDQPIFYLSPSLGNDAVALTNQLIDGDPRFLLLSAPAEEGSYNYADDEALCQLIQQGGRGAYWDIIRQHRKSKF
jgi:radical SAM superfamily enzyme YgiQ (UPF0313 family)